MKRAFSVGRSAGIDFGAAGFVGKAQRPVKSTIGITISTTGPAAALGIPERNALEFRAEGDRRRCR